jgi:hypothetical protein
VNRLVNMPSATFNPADGLLLNDHFQVAYVTNDLTRAREVLRSRYGIANFRHLEAKLQDDGYIQLELAWVGGIMIELVWAHGPNTEFYNDRLPAREFAIRHHHLGYFIHDQSNWNALQETIRRGRWNIVLENKIEGFMRWCYVDAPELGHYLEYIFPDPKGVTFFEEIPGF